MKNYQIAILVIVVVILGLIFMGTKSSQDLDTNKNTDNIQEEVKTTTNTSTKTTTTPKPTTSLATNLFPQTGSYACRYDQVSQTSRSSNTVYIADGKMRGEFRTTDSKGMTTSNIMVYNSPNLYIWVEGKSVGTVTQPRSLKDIPAVVPTNVHEGRVLGSGTDNVSWDCHAWSKVPSLITKPTYVTFY